MHIYGTCRPIHSPDELKAIVNRLTRDYESQFETPWTPEYSDALLKGIVGLEISIREIQCKFKLNQNRSDQDRAGVISGLEELGPNEMASAMKENER